MLETKENVWRTQEELLVEYMNYIPKQEYEEMYAMLHIEAWGNVSQEDFATRNSAIYEGIEVQNMDIRFSHMTGTAEIKASRDDILGTELGWFAIFITEDTLERPILIISMAEDVKERGGSGYVVKKDKLVLEE